MASLASRQPCPAGLGPRRTKVPSPLCLAGAIRPKVRLCRLSGTLPCGRASGGASRRCRRSSLAPAQTAASAAVAAIFLAWLTPMLHCPCQTPNGDALNRSPFLLDPLTPPTDQACPDVCGSCNEDGTCAYCGLGTMQVGNESSTGAVTCVKCKDPLCYS